MITSPARMKVAVIVTPDILCGTNKSWVSMYISDYVRDALDKTKENFIDTAVTFRVATLFMVASDNSLPLFKWTNWSLPSEPVTQTELLKLTSFPPLPVPISIGGGFKRDYNELISWSKNVCCMIMWNNVVCVPRQYFITL